jgi:hypothetical protein
LLEVAESLQPNSKGWTIIRADCSNERSCLGQAAGTGA